MEPGYRLERGYMWPDFDRECAAVVFDTFDSDGMAAVKLCKQRRGVIQAGGNCGVWAMRFKQFFEHVYTFEPDPRNFKALSYNVRDVERLYIRNMGLGEHNEELHIYEPEPNNCGATAVSVNSNGFPIRVTRIDDEHFVCPIDLIYLDVEGFELFAIKGGIQTIDKYRPVVVFEDKGLSEKYGVAKGDAEIYLAQNHNYRVVDRRNRDVYMVYDGADA